MWTKTTVSIEGEEFVVDLHTSIDAAAIRLELDRRPPSPGRIELEGNQYSIQTVRDVGDRGERFEVDAALLVEPDPPARKSKRARK